MVGEPGPDLEADALVAADVTTNPIPGLTPPLFAGHLSCGCPTNGCRGVYGLLVTILEAETDPDVYLPDLASVLNNLSNRLDEAGRRAEGLVAAERAVAIRERLAEANLDT